MNPKVDFVDHRAHILIVDDERANRDLLEIMLAPEGYLLTMAASGEEALAAIERAPPDLVLLDLMMPGMDGYQVVARIKTSLATKTLPVIVVTALDNRSARLLALQAGAADFLSKPVDHAELSARVRNLVRLKAYGDYHDRHSQMLESEVGARTTALAESERLYRSTFDAAPVGIAHVALDGGWVRVNQRLCDLFGYSTDELEGASPDGLLHTEDALGEADSLVQLRSGAIQRHVIDEKRYVRKDGSSVWARVNMSLHRDSEGRPQHFIAVIEDITERRTLETQLRQANKMDAIGSLAAGVAHDFNNLLSIVLSYSELLGMDLEKSHPMRADLEEINRAGHRAVALTRQLLAFSRQQVLQPTEVDLGSIVDGMKNMLRRLLGEDIELTSSTTQTLAKIMVDAGQMEQVIMNLAVNARDAMPRGGELSIETSGVLLDAAFAAQHLGVTAGPHVLLRVCDTGVGMDKATQARMFEPFFTTKDVGKGTGLGLSTVFGIVRQSGGTISTSSQPDQGTRFDIYFPTAKGHAPKGSSLRPTSDPRALRGSETILLVEDDEHFRALARTILSKYGYTVLEAQSGGDAFLLCEEYDSTIHLLLTDVVMPRMSGRQLAERLLKIRPEMGVLYMSGYADDAVLRHGIMDSAFMQKPITPETLAMKVRATLGEMADA